MLRQRIQSKNIDKLCHFTRLNNLNGILTNGLIPRATLEDNSCQFDYNDEMRFNGQKEATCLSIQFPNYKMFYGLRSNNPEIDWVVIYLKPEILWEKDCAFCVDNAASNKVTIVELEKRKGIEAFNLLYDNTIKRNENLPDSYPSNPQAEVLVFDEIEVDYIEKIITDKPTLKDRLAACHKNIVFECSHEPYSARRDWRDW